MEYFQGVVLDILVALGIIRSHHIWLDVEHIEEAYQNILVCVWRWFSFLLSRSMHAALPYRDDGSATSRVKIDKKRE